MIIIPGTSLPSLSNPGAASDLKNGKQLIDSNGNVITGSMPNVSAASPSISVSTGGLITASYTQEEGYIAGTTKNATKQLTTQAGTTITPGTTQKTACASGRYTTGNIYVAGDADLKASNIKSGVNIFGVAGTYSADVLDYYFRTTFQSTASRVSTSGYQVYYRAMYDDTRPSAPSGTTWSPAGVLIGFWNGFYSAITSSPVIYANGSTGIAYGTRNITNTYLEFGIDSSMLTDIGAGSTLDIVFGFVIFLAA